MSLESANRTRFASLAGRRSLSRTLAAYQHAGAVVYDLVSAAEERRSELAAGGESATDPEARALLLCAWNASALQTLADALVKHRRSSQTSRQALAFYAEVSRWAARGQRAGAGGALPGGQLSPARLPLIEAKRPWSSAHAQAMLAACSQLRLRAETAPVDAGMVGGGSPQQLAYLRSTLADSAAAHDFASRVSTNGRFGGLSRELRQKVQQSLTDALNGFYLAGQYAAVPALADPVRALTAAPAEPEVRPAVVLRPGSLHRRAALTAALALGVAGVLATAWASASRTPLPEQPLTPFSTSQPARPFTWKDLRFVHGVTQIPDPGSPSGYEPDPFYQNLQREETTAFTAARPTITKAGKHPTGEKLASDIILANPDISAEITAARDPAGTGNVRTNGHAAQAAFDAGIGVGASSQREFVAVAYTVYGTRCVFRFNYRTGVVTVTPQ
jgi:hypothetical protein